MDPVEIVQGRRRGRSWSMVGHALHYRGAPDRHAALLAWQRILPGYCAFTHLTAAQLHGLWLPTRWPKAPVFVGLPRERTRPKRPELRPLRCSRNVAPVMVDGLRVVPVAEAVLACARDLGVLDLTVLVDSARRHRGCSLSALEEAASSGGWGAPALQDALALSDERSESAWETVLRLFHRWCGAAVQPQHVVRDERGAFVARGDLWLQGTRTLHEYDGAVHRDRRTHVADLARERRIVNVGWIRRGYTAQDLLSRGHLVLRDVDAALGRPHEPRRLEPWYAALRRSMLTPTGRARTEARWRR